MDGNVKWHPQGASHDDDDDATKSGDTF